MCSQRNWVEEVVVVVFVSCTCCTTNTDTARGHFDSMHFDIDINYKTREEESQRLGTRCVEVQNRRQIETVGQEMEQGTGKIDRVLWRKFLKFCTK